jgi:hypothetical protein
LLAYGQQDPPAPTPAGAPGPEKSDSAVAALRSSPLPDLTPDANGKISQEQIRQLFRVVADKAIENEKRQRDYTYIDREVQHDLDGKGKTKSTEVKTYEILEIYREQVHRPIQKDDKALDAK